VAIFELTNPERDLNNAHQSGYFKENPDNWKLATRHVVSTENGKH